MESIYYVLSRACHRKCVRYCADRFRAYVRGELIHVVEEAKASFPRIIAHLGGGADLAVARVAP